MDDYKEEGGEEDEDEGMKPSDFSERKEQHHELIN